MTTVVIPPPATRWVYIMQLIIAVTDAFSQWLNLDLPTLPTEHGGTLGRASLRTGTQSLAWQGGLSTGEGGSATAIMLEAHSRYTILLPFSSTPSQDELQKVLIERWAKEIAHLAVTRGKIRNEEMEELFRQFLLSPIEVRWYRNHDARMQAHLNDAEQALLQTLEEYGLQQLDEDEAITLGMQINQQAKRIERHGASSLPFYPMEHFLDDALYRFASQLSAYRYPDTPPGDFPNPYQATKRRPPPPQDGAAPNNVVSLERFVRDREED